MGTTSLYSSCKTLLNTEEVDENTFINVVRNLTYYIFRKLKKYIKTASCYPELCEKQDYTTIMNDFHESEKVFLNSKNVVTLICHWIFVKGFCILPVDQVHLLMLAGEAKVQAALLYSMRAVQAHFNNRG